MLSLVGGVARCRRAAVAFTSWAARATGRQAGGAARQPRAAKGDSAARPQSGRRPNARGAGRSQPAGADTRERLPRCSPPVRRPPNRRARKEDGRRQGRKAARGCRGGPAPAPPPENPSRARPGSSCRGAGAATSIARRRSRRSAQRRAPPKAARKPDGPTGSGASRSRSPTAERHHGRRRGPPFAGTPVGGCVAARFRGATFRRSAAAHRHGSQNLQHQLTISAPKAAPPSSTV